VHVICLTFVSTYVYFDNKIQFNSIQKESQHFRINKFFQLNVPHTNSFSSLQLSRDFGCCELLNIPCCKRVAMQAVLNTLLCATAQQVTYSQAAALQRAMDQFVVSVICPCIIKQRTRLLCINIPTFSFDSSTLSERQWSTRRVLFEKIRFSLHPTVSTDRNTRM